MENPVGKNFTMMWVRYVVAGLLIACMYCCPVVSRAQAIQGTVYDITQKNTLPFVTVFTTSGKGTLTDSSGNYNIPVQAGDSIWFSYLGKSTPKYAVNTIPNPAAFDVSVLVSAIELPGITLRKSNYHLDSLQNRKDYEKIFNYRKPGVRITALDPSGGSIGPGVGVDINELINVFRFRRNKNMKFLQGWLLKEEQEAYVDYRFNRGFIRKLTNINEDDLDEMMKYCRPDYEVVALMNDAELGMYILDCYKDYKEKKRQLSR